MGLRFIFMLTSNDRTVEDAEIHLSTALAAGIHHIGFNDIGLSYGEFYGGSFELFSKIFHRSDPDIFEFEIPTAVILLNGTSKKKVVRF